jgi:hypothetical protein
MQTTSSTTPLFKMLMQYRLSYAGGDTNIFVRQTSATDTFKIPCNKHITGITVDPENWVLNRDGSVVMAVQDNAKTALPIHCFPNPCNDYIDVSFASNGIEKHVSIHDVTGRCVSRVAVVTGGRINLSNLGSGVYFLSVADGEKTGRAKFTKL